MRTWAAMVLGGLAVCCTEVSSRSQQAVSWPSVSPLKSTFRYERVEDAEAVVEIKDTMGKPQYRLECHNWRYEKDPAFDYSGDFECKLVSINSAEVYSTLLTDNPDATRDWQSRGRFQAQQLLGKCGDFPEYGRVRNFRLRGMRIRLALSDVKVGQGRDIVNRERTELKSFSFSVQVDPDLSASSEIAEMPKIQKPPGECR